MLTTKQRRAFTVLELLVSVSVLATLVGLMLPAVVAAREATRKSSCFSNMRQIGLAVHAYHDSNSKIPEAWKPVGKSTTVYGWAVDLLPFMEESSLYTSLNRNAPITASSSTLCRTSSLSIMTCPSDIAKPSFDLHLDDPDDEDESSSRDSQDAPLILPVLTTLPTANYVGVFGSVEPEDDEFPGPIGDGTIITDRRVRFASLTRGLSKTLVVGERTMAMIPSTWFGVDLLGDDPTCRLVGSAMTKPNCTECEECEFASRHAGGANFLWADGHVSTVSNDIDQVEYRRLARRR